ncbi:MAG: NADH-quinone oxidoreductase subunit C [Gemmatimonadota bacterium]
MTEPVTVADDAAASVAAARARFPEGVVRSHVVNGQTVLYVTRAAAHAILAYLQRDAAQRFNYLTDITCVEYRDRERELEVVYQLRSLARRVDLRVKIGLDPEGPLDVATVTDLWYGAEWLEREAWDMFGVVFAGHGDLRRILMWETYSEGHPLRKSFPLRGHWSRAEQTRQALNANPEAHYSLEELSISEAYRELPKDMQQRLAESGRGPLP